MNLLEESEGMVGTHATVTALFSKYDCLQLERVVGSGRCKKMLTNESPTLMFC